MHPSPRQTVMFCPPPELLEALPAWWDIPVPELPPTELGLERARGLWVDFVRRDRRFLRALDTQHLTWVDQPLRAAELLELHELMGETWAELLALEGGELEALRLPSRLRRLRARHEQQTAIRRALLDALDFKRMDSLLHEERQRPVGEWEIQEEVSRTLYREDTDAGVQPLLFEIDPNADPDGEED